MKISRQTFRGVHLDDITVDEEIVLEHCSFVGGSLGASARNPDRRLTVARVHALGCSVSGVVVGPVIFDGVEISDLRIVGHLWLPGCAFRRCAIRGRVGKLLHFDAVDPTEGPDASINQAFADANRRFYEDVDWAIDISQAQCDDLDLRGVPAHLVRINDSTQVRVSYEAASALVGQGLGDDVSTFARRVLENSLVHRSETRSDFVLATHPEHSRFRDMLQLFEVLLHDGAASR
ncbi:MAG: hypothetical protein KJ067_24070 [Vicinamibacteria bacterium]|nr:hypothetical protein [Vicinamibacteria bacterium]